jgi:succinyl-CoA synthetase beta subunit
VGRSYSQAVLPVKAPENKAIIPYDDIMLTVKTLIAEEVAKNMCGKILVSAESGQQGFLCRCVYIVEELEVWKELYLCVKHDRKCGTPVIIYGAWNG